MKILVIGSGGREHALAWKFSQSSLSKEIFVAPGNAGTYLDKKLKNINIQTNDILSLLKFAKHENINLTVVGPEEPLVHGIVDVFRSENLKILGPTKKASQLEGSKIFAKEFLTRHNIPTASYKKFNNTKDAIDFVKHTKLPIVIKADSLAAGKGVFIARTFLEAKKAIEDILQKKIFKNNSYVIIEEFLAGKEISFIVMTDGKTIIPLETSKDYKLSGNNDTGTNTGGMGAYSPSLFITNDLNRRIMNQIILPTIHGMNQENNTYSGFLYAGLMVSDTGQLKVLEFNCRSGDPETQPIMMRLKSDLVELCMSICNGNLQQTNKLQWDERVAITVVMATRNYPNYYTIDNQIYGLQIDDIIDSKIFHSGTKFLKENIVTNGGRVLSVTSLGKNLTEAKERSYNIIKQISWKGSFYRNDIGNI